jgi:predicted membrane protein
MKMGFGIFWGIVFILIGIGIVIKVVFHIDFPIFKVLIALFFIYIGVRMLVGFHGCNHFRNGKEGVIFGQTNITGTDIQSGEHNVLFGKALLDLRTLELKDQPVKLKVNTVFGNTEIKIKRDMPCIINGDIAFGNMKMPDGNHASFGNIRYTSPTYSADSVYLQIDADVAFGNIEVETF